jgi:hypothetical protein
MTAHPLIAAGEEGTAMRLSNVKPVIIGASAAAVVIAITAAASGSGIGGVFGLGKTNTVNATSGLTGSTRKSMLSVTNKGKGTALSLQVGRGRAPFSVNSSAQVAKLNASLLSGLAASQFVQGGGQSRSFGFTLDVTNSAKATSLLAVPGFGTFQVVCEPGTSSGTDEGVLEFKDGTHTLDEFISGIQSNSTVSVFSQVLTPITLDYFIGLVQSNETNAVWHELILRYTTGSGHSLTTHMATVTLTAEAEGTTCDFDASAVTGPGVTRP